VVETRSEVVNDVPDNHSEPQVGLTDISESYTQMLWMGLKMKAAYLPG
jgi:hypothetical protein